MHNPIHSSPLVARARDQRGVLGAVVVVLAMSGLVTGLVWSLVSDGEARALTAAAMRADGPAGSGSADLITVTVVAPDDAPTPGLTDMVAPTIDEPHAGVPVSVSTWAQSPVLPFGRTDPAGGYLLELDHLDARTRVTEGRLPLASVHGTEVAIPVDMAAALGLDVGDTLALFGSVAAEGNGESPVVDATVVGIVDLIGAEWDRDLLQGRGVATDRGWLDTFGPLLTAPGVVSDRTDEAAPARLSIAIDPSFAAGVDLPAFADSVRALGNDLGRALGDSARASVRSDVTDLADAAARDVAVTRYVVLAASAITVALAVIALSLTGSLVVARRQTETTLWQARGASAGQLAARAAREALALGVVAALLAVPSAIGAYAALLRTPVLSRAWPLTDAMQPVARGTVLAVVIGVAVPMLALIAAAAIAPSGKQRGQLGGAGRTGIDLAAVVLAGAAVWQLSRRGVGGEVDLTSVLAPMLVVLACGALALRVIPLALTILERSARRSRRLVLALAGWSLARSGASRGAYLFASGAAAIVISLTTVGTWTASAVQQADMQVGADAVVAEPLAPGLVTGAAATSACSNVTAVSDRPILLGSRPAGTRLVAFDVTRSGVVRGEPGTASSWGQALEPLLPREEAGGWHVPDGELEVAVSGRMEVEGAQLSAGVIAILEDGYGDRFPSTRVEVPLDGEVHRTRFDVPDAEVGDWWVVGFAISVQADSSAPDRVTSDAEVAGAISISMDEAGEHVGDETDRRPDAEWNATVPDSATTLRANANAAGPAAIAIDLSAREYEVVWSAVSMMVTAFAGPEEVPVLIATDFARDLGAETGDAIDIRVEGATVTARVAGTVHAIPSHPHSEALIADIDTLSRALLVQGNTQRLTDAWWLGLDCGTADAAELDALPAVTLLSEVRADAEAGPLRVAAWMSLWIAGVAAAVFVIAGAAVRSAARVRSRSLVVARLRGVGVPARTAGASEMLQHALLVVAATVVGAGCGALGAWIVAPLVVVAPGGLPAVPEPAWAAGGVWPWWLAGAALTAVLISTPWVRALARRSPASVLRGGDDA